MARTKSGTPVRSDRLLMILCNGGVVSLKEIEDTMDYHNMYRISCEVYCIKLGGGIVKTHKEGRKVVAYELVNPQEMIDKMLTLNDLNAKAVDAPSKLAQAHAAAAVKSAAKKKVKAPVIEDEVTEVTE